NQIRRTWIREQAAGALERPGRRTHGGRRRRVARKERTIADYGGFCMRPTPPDGRVRLSALEHQAQPGRPGHRDRAARGLGSHVASPAWGPGLSVTTSPYAATLANARAQLAAMESSPSIKPAARLTMISGACRVTNSPFTASP